MSKIGIGGENVPPAIHGYRANQDVHNGNHDSLGSAITASLGRRFVVRRIDRPVRERNQRSTQLFELGGYLDAGQQILPYQPDDASAPLADEFSQFRDNNLFVAAEIFGPTPNV